MPDTRSLGLILAGAAQILAGIGSALILLYIASGSELAARQGAGGGAAVASSLVTCGIATVYFVAVGIGSIRRRRWAQALSLVVSSIWLAAGVVATLLMLVMPDAPLQLSAVAIAVLAVIPLILVVFYSRDSVRLECEAADEPRWTDRVPLPVLAVVIILAFASVTLIANLANPVLTMFGSRVTGAPAALALLGLAMLCAWLALQLYRLSEAAWWTIVLLQAIGCVAAGVTLARGHARSGLFIAIVVATWLAYFAYLLFLRRYFGVRGTEPRTRRSDLRSDQFTFSG